jgi:hypothetical protein
VPAPAVVVAPVAAVRGSDPGAVWEAVRASAGTSKYLSAIVGELAFLGLAAGVARLVGPRDIVQAARMKLTELENLFRQASGSPVRVQIEAAASEVREQNSGPGLATPAQPQAPRVSMQDHPLVKKAMAQLGATWVRAQPRIRPPGEPPVQGA